jgi:NhaP-type Na+/H+ or K+/H+ antiporter
MTSDLSQLGFLLFVSALVAMLTRRLHLPYTVGLVLAGMGLYFLHIYIKWHLTQDLIFFVFIPPLVFEAALCISWREFKKELPVITLLASAGVLIAAAVTSAGMHCPLNWDWGGAVVFGVLIAATDPVSVMLLAGRTPDYLVEITFTTLAAYGSFFVAEHFHMSGVLAALTAGLLVGNFRSSALITDAGRHALEPFWEYVAFIANSLIFFLIGAQEAQQHFKDLWLPVIVAILLVTLGRAAAIYPLCAVFSRSSLKVQVRHQHVLVWGGLRGALALALALSLPEDLSHHDAIVTITFAVVAFSVFAQGLTITPMLRWLKLLHNDRQTNR